MGSIWKIETNEIASLEAFASEYQMEAFLMNNPALLGCGGDGEEGAPFLLQQISARRKGGAGRIDLVGLTVDQERPILKIFELKNQAVTSADIGQLQEYLSNWDREGSGKELVRQRLRSEGFEKDEVEPILASPKGVSVGSRFDAEAIMAARTAGFEAIRLARFRARSNEYYVVVEDVVGKPTSSHRNFSWREDGISEKDIVYIQLPDSELRLRARPNAQKLDSRGGKEIIFEPESIQQLVTHRESVLEFVRKEWPHETQWVEQKLARLGEGQTVPLALTPATGLASFLAAKKITYWTPSLYWIVERTGQRITDIEGRLRASS
jgi:hypothetical protein